MRASILAITVRGLLGAIALLPLPAIHGLGWLLGSALYRFPNKLRRDARVNLKLCLPELDERARAKLMRQSLRETGKALLEVAAFWQWPLQRVDRLVKQVEGEELLRDGLARGGGVIVAVPHLGAWELLCTYYSTRLPLNSLYRPPRQSELDPLVRQARERGGAHSHPATPSGIRSLYKALSQGELAAILPDQQAQEGGVFAPFFGVPAKTMTLLPKLAARSQAPVVVGYAERLPWARGYRFRFVEAPAAVASADLQEATAAMNKAIEECARQALAQYQWTYRRFRERPAGAANPYRGEPL